MKFSVITITLNADRYLSETLSSVQRQQNVELEHIVWDGGSKDGTLKIAHSYPHVRVIEGKDKGISDAMNQAAEYAKGDFLIYLHADDFFAHSKALLMVERILNLHPDTQWLYGQAQMIDEKGQLLRKTPYEFFAPKRLRKYNFITHPAVCLSKAIFRQIGGFDTQLKYCMDYDLWLRLARFSKPLAVPVVLANFREHLHSISTNEPIQVTDEAYLVRNRYVHSLYERFRSYRTWKTRKRRLVKG